MKQSGILLIVLLLCVSFVSAGFSNGGSYSNDNYVKIEPGDNIQAKVDASPAGTKFLIKKGYHRLQSITPKDDMQFIGEDGAVLSGARILTLTGNELMKGVIDKNTFVFSGQTQEGQRTGFCATGDLCTYPDDVFVDNFPLTRVESVKKLKQNTFFFDYAADKIYVKAAPKKDVPYIIEEPLPNEKSNPQMGLPYTIEAAVTRTAFKGTAKNVVIKNLVIEKYAAPAQFGAIDAGPDWTVEKNIIRLNHGRGVDLADGMKLINNKLIWNGQMGFGGAGKNMLIKNNQIRYNNYAGFSYGWEAGGFKIAFADGVQIACNLASNNNGPGMWTDIDNINVVYDHNLVKDNTGIGIFHEISAKATIMNNVVKNNAITDYPWLYGAQIMSSSSKDVEIKNNWVEVSDKGGNGITMVQQNRGATHMTTNNNVHDNTVIYKGTTGVSGGAADYDSAAFYAGGNIFDKNTYVRGSSSENKWPDTSIHWAWNGFKTFAQFQTAGMDVNGKSTSSLSHLPGILGGSASQPFEEPYC